ncbi:hypothetical protein MTO96_012786 [Rhipicephalus appendiculatus]
MVRDSLEVLESMVKREHLGDGLPMDAGVARPQTNQKRRAWQKAAPGHDAAQKLGGPSSLKMAENGGPSGQVNDRHHRCVSPTAPSGVTRRNQAATTSRPGVATQAVAPRAQTLPRNTTVGGARDDA